MAGKRTTGSQDMTMADAESNSTISDLLDIIKELDERLDKAIKLLEQHEINTDDI